MPSNGESTVRWGHADDLLFELSSGDADLLKQALTVFCPWLTRRTATPLCHWQVERKSDKFASAGARWQVQEDGTSDVFTRDTPEKALLAVEFSAVMKCDECCHYLSLHGALLSKNHRGVVIVGPCEAGKSTLSCSLWQHGWSFLCDDVTLVDAEAGWAYPTPRRVSLRPGSRKLLIHRTSNVGRHRRRRSWRL